jgi:TPR repeat protein
LGGGSNTHHNTNNQTHNNSSAVGNDIEASEMSPQRGRNKGYEYWLEAECLLHGHGIEPNKDFAITWFERSANQGEPKALNALGCIYEQGNGVKVDTGKGVEYFRQGAALGEPHSQFKLA